MLVRVNDDPAYRPITITLETDIEFKALDEALFYILINGGMKSEHRRGIISNLREKLVEAFNSE